jgi:hypothetical protein
MIGAVADELARIYLAGYAAMGPAVLASSFELPNTAAATWARMHAGELIRGVDEVTQRRVGRIVSGALSTPAVSATEIRTSLRTAFADMSAERADLIARTELATAANAGALSGYRETGRAAVGVSDGVEFDEECRIANGQIWSLDYAMANLVEHPDCSRSFDPISDEEALAAGVDQQ